ncbi:MAG: tyrosine--tRNA ligase [Chthoniobacterales bacterium]
MSGSADLESLSQGCAQILSRDELAKRLTLGRPLRVKLGVDPTAPDIHFGHTVTLAKLRQFQDAGHQAVLILGDFTAMVGDPSGRSITRPQLTREEVLANAKTYQEQAFKVLDPDKTEVVFNGEWFGKMGFSDIIRLNSRVTLQQMLQREDFKARMNKGQPVGAHEIQYPIMQGWDSVMIRSDVELGGTDQLFNILVGRDLQIEEKQLPQIAMMLPILEGTDGVQKMSKSLGNSIGVTEDPKSMFGKIMSIPDEVMGTYYKLLLMESLPGDAHPMDAKKALAGKLVTRFHSQSDAKMALEDFEQRFSQRDLDSADLPIFPIGEARSIIDIVVEAYAKNHGQTRSKSDARRLVTQGSLQWNGEKILDPKHLLGNEAGVLNLDKRRAVRIG